MANTSSPLHRVSTPESLSDNQLIAAVAEVLSTPRRDPADSFVLHAPLELAARATLLPLVEPGARTLARRHIAEIAVEYSTFDAAEFPANTGTDLATSQLDDHSATNSCNEPPPSHDDLVADLAAALDGGDLAAVDDAVLAIVGRPDATPLILSLADAVVHRTAAAAHAPIFLYHLGRSHPLGGLSPALLRPLARELAREPSWCITWLDRVTAPEPSLPTDPTELAATVGATPLLGSPGSNFIRPLLQQVDTSASIIESLTSTLGAYSDRAANAVLRVAALSMLADSADHAPYGWTHCLTLPQAVLGLVGHMTNPDRALAIATTQVAAFRAGLGAKPLSTSDLVEDPASVVEREHGGRRVLTPTQLATAVATSHDAHIAKYGLACLDAAATDPAAAELFLAAGSRLLEVWDERGGDPHEPEWSTPYRF